MENSTSVAKAGVRIHAWKPICPDEPFAHAFDRSLTYLIIKLEARDSRTFGPVSMADIMGRVIYSLRSAVDHGPIKNSRYGMQRDNPVLAVELDVDEMTRNHKT